MFSYKAQVASEPKHIFKNRVLNQKENDSQEEQWWEKKALPQKTKEQKLKEEYVKQQENIFLRPISTNRIQPKECRALLFNMLSLHEKLCVQSC